MRRRPWVTLGLIAVNVAIFLYQLHLGPDAAAALFVHKGAVASKLSHPKLVTSYQALKLLPTMFSSLFLHAGWLHLIGNMWFLWLFGEALEDDLGHGALSGLLSLLRLFCLSISRAGRLTAHGALDRRQRGHRRGAGGLSHPAAQVAHPHPVFSDCARRLAGAGLCLAGAVAGPAILRPAPGRAGGLGGPPGGLLSSAC